MPNFIADFLALNSGTECHKNYLRWAAVSALATCAGPRYRLFNGTYYIYPMMYIIYVGGQGTRKTYAMGRAKDLVITAFPDYPIGANVTSRDDLIRLISSDATERAYVDQETASTTYHPLALYISEFKNFTSYSPSMMIDFIVDVYDYADKVYQCSTIKRGAEDSEHPFISILACENTDWFIKRLKEGIVTGGFSRRFIVIYEWDKPDAPRPRIIVPFNAKEIHSSLVSHLRNLHTTAKDFHWTPAGIKRFDDWYIKNFHSRQEDASIAGFMSTKDQALLKLCICLDLAETSPKYLITDDLIDEGLAWFSAIEPNLIKLYSRGGRNELAAEQGRLIDLIDTHGGVMAEKEVMRIMGKDLAAREYQESVKHLTDTDRMIRQAFRWPDDQAVVKTWLVSVKGLGRKEVAEAIRRFNNNGAH